jgi:glycosyltransferase involved in cell wall biosynthesis
MVRIAICQPVVPHYRVPVFNRLAALPDIELTVFAAMGAGSVRTASAGPSFRFDFRLDPVRPVKVGGLQFKYQDSQVEAVDPGRFDLVILMWDAHYLSLWPAILRSRMRKGPPVVLWGHGVSKRESALRRGLRNFLGRRADAVMVYTRTVADSLIREYGFERERVFVAQNALDQAPIVQARQDWEGDPGKLAEFRGRHGLDPRWTLAFVSRLEPDNGLDLLLAAFAEIRASRPEAKLVIIGDGTERERLERVAGEAGLADAVIFVGALFQESEIAPWLFSAAAFCYPKNMGLSLLHGFGYGLPVVTSDNLQGHGPEIEALRPGQNGLLYRDGDASDLARQTLRLLENPVERQAMAEQAARTVRDEYTLVSMVAGFEAAVSNLVKAQQ